MPRSLWIVPTFLLLGCTPGGGSTDIIADTEPEVEEVSPLVSGLDLFKVSITQGVDIVLLDDNNEIPDVQVPIIRKRDAMLRIFVDPLDDWEDRKVQAAVKVTDNSGEELFTTTRSIDERSKQADLKTTLNIDIPAEFVTASMSIQIELLEKDEDGPGGGLEEDVTWTSADLDLQASDKVEIVVYPIRYNADGSGRLPDTSDSQLERMHDFFLAMYPVTDITISVANPIDWNRTISANGNGWGDLLGEMSNRRDQANVDPNTYFYGLFAPATSLGQFCGYGCVLGLSNLAYGTNQDWYKASIGLGFIGQATVDTMVHEVGHAHGREHSPCGGASGADRDYPYNDAELGTWGYNWVDDEIYKPQDYRDMMSYCAPIWVSDYTYYNIWQQVKAVGDKRRAVVEKQPWQAVRVDMDGTVHMEHVFQTGDPSEGGQPMTVSLHDDLGNEINQVEGYFYPYSHIDGGIVLIPQQDDQVVEARVPALAL